MSEPIKVWLSKHALTGGVREVEVWDNGDGWVVERGRYSTLYKLGRDAHLTRPEAVATACGKRDRRVAQLEAQIAKLRAKDMAA